MSDEETPETGDESTAAAEEASDSSETTAAEEAPPPAPDKKRKKTHRKPVWVLIPVEWEEVAVPSDDGSMTTHTIATKYAVGKCEGGEGQKKEILRFLARHNIDPTNYDQVVMLRADPIDFAISQQIIIRI